MKSGFTKILSLSVAVATFHCVAYADDNAASAPSTNQPAITDPTEKLSYSVGIDIGNMIKRAGFEVDAKVVGEGIADVIGGKTPKLTDQQARETIMAYQQQIRARREQERQKIAEKNRETSAKFLAENKTKPGVKIKEVKAQDGSTNELQYKIVVEGSGDSPKAEDTVTFNYRATTIDGKELDSSAKRGQPGKAVIAHYPIAGVKEALQSMKPGAKWQLYIPSNLAFGDAGAGQNVEPGSAIIYDVELLSVDTPQPLTSDIIKVPSKEELDKGAKIEVIKPEDVKKMTQTNTPTAKKK